MRWTKKEENHYKLIDYISEVSEEEIQIQANKKLGEYEDIEDDLGITFSLLVKILKNGINEEYNKDEYRYIPGENLILDIKNKCFYCDYTEDDRLIFYFKDYMYTWALTKNELELPF